MPAKEQILLGIDLGTSGCTALGITLDGRLAVRADGSYPLLSPKPGWAEQRAADWWEAIVTAVRDCVDQLDPTRQQIAGIGIDSHLEAFVPVDDTGEALANGLLWIDQRTVPQADQIKKLLPERWVIETTGVPINHVNPAAKILWLKQNMPQSYDDAVVMLSPKDYAVFRMTGQAWTDYSIASKTMLFGLAEEDWCAEICNEIGVDMSKLPPVQGAWQIAGCTSSEFETLTGLKAGSPVATGGGDDHCQALGGGAVEPGSVNIGSGTGSAWKALISEPRPDLHGRVECHQHILPHTWIYWTGINATGYSVKWFIDNFGLRSADRDGFAAFETLAGEVEPGSEGLFFYPHLWGARAPRFNPEAAGVFFGITRAHGTAHFCRAILEGVAYQYLAILEILADLGVEPSRLTLVGGETHNALWNQIKADVVGQEILVPEIQDGSPLGAAMLAGLAVEAYTDADDAVGRVIRWKHCVKPREEHTRRYCELYDKYSAVYDMIEPAYQVLGETGAGSTGGLK